MLQPWQQQGPHPLATGQPKRMGLVEDKVIKNHYASNIYKHKDTKTCGVIEEDKAGSEIAEPIGVLAAVIPTTTTSAIFKCLPGFKTRNGISPHPVPELYYSWPSWCWMPQWLRRTERYHCRISQPTLELSNCVSGSR